MDKTKINYKSEKLMVALTPEMKRLIETHAEKLGVSEAGFLRLLVKMYDKGGGLKPENIFNAVG